MLKFFPDGIQIHIGIRILVILTMSLSDDKYYTNDVFTNMDFAIGILCMPLIVFSSSCSRILHSLVLLTSLQKITTVIANVISMLSDHTVSGLLQLPYSVSERRLLYFLETLSISLQSSIYSSRML